MEGKWIVEGFDLSPYIAEGGVSYGMNLRQGRDIVTLSGTLHRTETRKRTLSFSLVTVGDRALKTISAAIPSRGVLEYPEESGVQTSKTFYFTAPQYQAKTVRGGNTYYSGVSFEAEER